MRTAAKALIVSLNPAIDCEWRVPHVRWEEKNNILEERRWAGGKGSNVARWLRHLGGRPELLIPLGGGVGDELARYLRMWRVKCHVVQLKAATRVNVIVTSDQGQLRFNPLGPIISAKELSGLLSGLRAFCREQPRNGSSSVIMSGALPRGVPGGIYRTMIDIAHEFGVTAFLDCDGPAFAAGIRAKPFLVKPNVHELTQWFGKPFDLRRAVTQLSDITRGWVLVSQDAHGALLWNSVVGAGFSAHTPKVIVRNTVGAGDALMSGVIREVQRPARPEEWLRWGVATGTACVQNVGGRLADPVAIKRLRARIEVEPLKW